MIPGLSATAEARLQSALTPAVTAVGQDSFADRDFEFLTGRDPQSNALGIHLLDGPDMMLVVTDPDRPVGNLRIQTGGPGNLLFIDNRGWHGNLNGVIRILGRDCTVFFNTVTGGGLVGLTDLFMRSNEQFLYWGLGATAVECSIEIEGEGRGVAIGDDALISNGVWVRNHNMHALWDLVTDSPIGRQPVTTVVERHVWLGQDALLLNCPSIGQGSVIGARSLVNGPIPARVAAAGTPARVLREQVSWGRDTYRMTDAERRLLGP